jgi:hypothetical protein
LEQTLITFYHISLSYGRKEKETLTLVSQKAEEILKTTDFGLIAKSPDEKVGKGEFRDLGGGMGEEVIEERLFFEG